MGKNNSNNMEEGESVGGEILSTTEDQIIEQEDGFEIQSLSSFDDNVEMPPSPTSLITTLTAPNNDIPEISSSPISITHKKNINNIENDNEYTSNNKEIECGLDNNNNNIESNNDDDNNNITTIDNNHDNNNKSGNVTVSTSNIKQLQHETLKSSSAPNSPCNKNSITTNNNKNNNNTSSTNSKSNSLLTSSISTPIFDQKLESVSIISSTNNNTFTNIIPTSPLTLKTLGPSDIPSPQVSIPPNIPPSQPQTVPNIPSPTITPTITSSSSSSSSLTPTTFQPITKLSTIVWKKRSGFGKYWKHTTWERRLLVLDGTTLSYHKLLKKKKQVIENKESQQQQSQHQQLLPPPSPLRFISSNNNTTNSTNTNNTITTNTNSTSTKKKKQNFRNLWEQASQHINTSINVARENLERTIKDISPSQHHHQQQQQQLGNEHDHGQEKQQGQGHQIPNSMNDNANDTNTDNTTTTRN